MIEQVYLTHAAVNAPQPSQHLQRCCSQHKVLTGSDIFSWKKQVPILLLQQEIIFHPHLSSVQMIYIQITTYSNFVGSFYVKNKILDKGNFIKSEDNT